MKKLAYIAACAGALMLAGCDDFLTPDNKSAVTDEDYFSTKDGFQSLVYNVYSTLGCNGDDRMFNAKEAPGLFNGGTDLYCDGRNDNNTALHRWQNFTPENGTVKDFYFDCYDAIRACYAVQRYAPAAKVSDEVKAKAIDEGRFVAAFYYYLMVNNFGGVPLVTSYVESAPSGFPRASAETIYEHIISELKSIIANNALAASTAKVGGGEASIEAAKALLAKTYLAAAWDLDKKEYFALAARYADEVIAGRTLTTPFADLWAADCSGDDNEEFIWDVEYNYETAADKTKGNRWQTFYSNYYGGAEESMKNGSSSYIPTLHALEYFEKGDKRYEATFLKTLLVKKDWGEANMFKEGNDGLGDYFGFYENGHSAMGRLVAVYYPAHWESDAASIAAWRAEDPENRARTFVIPQAKYTWMMEPFTLYYKEYDADAQPKYDFENPATQKKTWSMQPCCKFDDSNTANYNGGYSFRDLHILTLPEMFLVASEAYLKDGKTTEALARLNSVRRRAGVADAATIDIDAILKESACEMFGNGYRRMDLRRTQKLVEYNNKWNPQLKGTAATAIGEKLLWPIPQAAIDSNGQLSAADQNPGY